MGRNLFITGVGSGIGAGLCREALRRGDRVFALGRKSPEDFSRFSGYRFSCCDLADADTIPAALKTLLEGVPALDLVILNAGILGRIADLRDTPLADLRHLMDVNLWANKVLVDALFALSLTLAQVVAVSTGASVSAGRGWNGYSLSKAALNMLIALYALEAPQTHFSALAPGLVETGMQDQVGGLPQDPRFPLIERLQKARNTPAMPRPAEAAPLLFAAMDRLLKFESGRFYDIRNLPASS